MMSTFSSRRPTEFAFLALWQATAVGLVGSWIPFVGQNSLNHAAMAAEVPAASNATELIPQHSRSGPTHAPPDQTTDIPGLIEQLASDQFRQRQQATVHLASLGPVALPALRKAASHPDGEVRWRARHIVQLIRDHDRERLIAAFLAGETIAELDALPGWEEFQAVAGSTPDTRQIYAQMLQTEGPFLDRIYSADRPLVPLLLAQRTAQLQEDLRRNRPIAVSSVAALLLIAGSPDVELANQMGMMALCYRTEFDRAIRSASGRQALKGLLGKVVARASDETLYAQRFHFSLHYDLPEGLAPARQVLTERSSIPHVRYYAVLVLAKMGNADDLKLVESMLDDSGEVVSMHLFDRRKISTQVRDIALAALVHRAGKPLEDFGLVQVRPDEKLIFLSTSVGFTTNEERDAAIARWRSHTDP